MKRYINLTENTGAKRIVTSNIREASDKDYRVDFSKYASKYPEIIDNSGIMVMKVMMAAGVQKLYVAGMDGYSETKVNDYFDTDIEYAFSESAVTRNTLIAEEIRSIKKRIDVKFITPTLYEE